MTLARITLALLACLLVAGAGTGLGQAQQGWDEFPLDPAPTAESERAAPPAGREGDRRSAPSDDAPTGGISVVIVGAALAAGVVLAAIALRRVRRGRPVVAPVEPAASPDHRPARSTTTIAPTLRENEGLDRCEVTLARWRNRAWFCALRPDSDHPIVASPEFPLRRRDPLTLTPAAIAALEALTVGLERLGWRYAGQGPAWFMRRFVGPQRSDGALDAPAGRSWVT